MGLVRRSEVRCCHCRPVSEQVSGGGVYLGQAFRYQRSCLGQGVLTRTPVMYAAKETEGHSFTNEPRLRTKPLVSRL
jgi:hypothetical protein